MKINLKSGKKSGEIRIDSTDTNNELYFYGDICSDTWQSEWYEEDKAPQDIVNLINSVDSSKSLDIHINSGGGSVFGGIAIYNILSRYAGKKTVYIDGLAASIASVIAMAGDKIVMGTGTQLMIHKPFESYFAGNADDMRREAEALDACEASIIEIYMQKAVEGVSKEDFAELMKAESWFTAETAKEYFNISTIETGEAVACTSDYFAKYKHVPENITKPKEKQPTNEEKTNSKKKLQLQLDLLAL